VTAMAGVVRYEYRMAIRRWGMWVAYALSVLPFISIGTDGATSLSSVSVWELAGNIAISLNFWMPVVAGIVIADRLPRDTKTGVRELLRATPLSNRGYVLGKYLGVVSAALTPTLAGTLLLVAIAVFLGGAPVTLLPAALVAFLAINVPAYLFVGAFSLVCPAILPVRVYQVLYTGYWFWGNFLNPKAIPTLAGSLLTPHGEFVADAFFHTGLTGFGAPNLHTRPEAVLNVVVLVACGAAVLWALQQYLARQERRA
jgi:ABC-2 type transport system permease protein